MKSRKFWVGLPVIVLVFTVVFTVILTSCDDAIDAASLEGMWYETPECTDTGALNFKAGQLELIKGKVNKDNVFYPYELVGSKLTLTGPNSQKLDTKLTHNEDYTELEVMTGVFLLKKGKYFKPGGTGGDGYQVPTYVEDIKADPPAGTYTGPQAVSLSCGTDGAKIYYTTNGDEPTQGSTEYTAPIPVSSGTITIKAIAVKSGMEDAGQSFQYTINPNYVPPQELTVTNAADAGPNATFGAGTLREAVSKIKSGGVIKIDSSVKTINLKGELDIYEDITIEGNGVTIKPAETGYPDKGDSLIMVGNNRTVTIKRVHFQSGKDADNGNTFGRGAAIYNKGKLTVESCIFDLNVTNKGGAIYNTTTSGSVAATNNGCIVIGCTFYNNSARSEGGAIYHKMGTLTLTGNLFYLNKAPLGNSTSEVTNGPIVYKDGNVTITSGGYNVTDIAIGTANNQSGWTQGTGDTTFSTLGITTAPINTTTFAPTSESLKIITSAPANFPAKDFNGVDRTWPGVPGAVK